MNEKQIETQILQWLNYQPGIAAIKINTVGIFDPKRGVFRKIKNKFIHLGTSDILGIAYGKPFAIEVKTPKTIKEFYTKPGSREIKQQLFLELVRKVGGYGTCVANLDDAISFIKSIKTQCKT